MEVSEKESDNHREVIQAIYNAMMQDMAIGKEHALAMRKDALQWHSGERREALGGFGS